MPLLNRRCKTASQWWMSVLTISPVFTSHTRTVESLDPLIMTFSSYWRHNTDPVCPVSTCNICWTKQKHLGIRIWVTVSCNEYLKQVSITTFSDSRTFVHCNVCLSHILIVLSRSPETIFESSYCKQYTPLEFSDLQLMSWRLGSPFNQLFSIFYKLTKKKRRISTQNQAINCKRNLHQKNP